MSRGIAGVAAAFQQRVRKSKSDSKDEMEPRDLYQKIVHPNKKYEEGMRAIYLQNMHPAWLRIAKLLVAIETHEYFGRFVVMIILLAGVSAGVATYDGTDEGTIGSVLSVVDLIILVVFILEALIKIGAKGNKPWVYFQDSWNVFDFTIIVFSLVPIDFDFAVFRCIRLLRVLKLLNALEDLRILVSSLLMSVKSIVYVLMLLGLVFYLYSVMACFLFRDNDPFHFRTLDTAILTMYRVSTFEDWTDVMYINIYGCDEYGYPVDGKGPIGLLNNTLPSFMFCSNPKATSIWAALFFCSFTLVSTMILFNLFIGVILTNIEVAQQQMKEKQIAEEFNQGDRVMRIVVYFLQQKFDTNQPDTRARKRWRLVSHAVLTGKWRFVFHERIHALRLISLASLPSSSLDNGELAERAHAKLDKLADQLDKLIARVDTIQKLKEDDKAESKELTDDSNNKLISSTTETENGRLPNSGVTETLAE